MKKARIVLAITLLCASLLSCGQQQTDPALSDHPHIDTTPAPDPSVQIISPENSEEVYDSVFTYLSALPKVGEDTPAPLAFVAQSYEELRAVYDAADACRENEMPVKGSWENIYRNQQSLQTYFKNRFAIVVAMITDDGYYDLAMDKRDSQDGIGLKVFGMRSYEQTAVRERHIFYCSFEGKYEGQSIDLEFSSTPYASQTEQNIFAFFSDWHDEIPTRPYFVVKSYEELMSVYACAATDPKEYGSYSLGIKGNWGEAKKNDLYNQQFFENNYIVVAMTRTGSGSYTFISSAELVEEEIVVTLNGTLPFVSTTDLGAYLFLLPMSGQYNGQSIRIVINIQQETSH